MPKPKPKFASKSGSKIPSGGRPASGSKSSNRSHAAAAHSSSSSSSPFAKRRRRTDDGGGPPTSLPLTKRGSKREIVFDPEARKNYLRGFSERKRQRRAFGLAMQKVKDRKDRIDQRAQERKDDLARVEEAERQKEELLEEVVRMNNGDDCDDDDNDDNDDKNNLPEAKIDDGDEDGADEDKETVKNVHQPETATKENGVIGTKVYDDSKTARTWGGQVTVTTSVVEVGDDDGSDDEIVKRGSSKSVDVAQKYAGNVQKYLGKLKGQMPSKKKDGGPKAKRKGRNGAADMQGMGGAANLKVAQKLLSKSKDSKSVFGGSGKKGKKGKR